MRMQPTAPDIWRARVWWRLIFIAAVGLLSAVGWWALPWQVYVPAAATALVVYALLYARVLPVAAWADWLNWTVDLAVIAIVVRYSGGAVSPFAAIAYVWLFGVIIVNLRSGARAPLPVFTVLAFVALAIGLAGSPDWWQGLAFHAVGLALMTLIGFELLKERSLGRMDAVTGVLHRRAGVDALATWIQRGKPFSLAFLDLRGFKDVNDTYGHGVGDEVLNAVAQRVAGAVRGDDVVMRYGGDEFVVASELRSVKRRIERTLDDPVATSVGRLDLGVDVGEVRWQQGTSLDSLLSLADKAMYAEKRSGIAGNGESERTPREETEDDATGNSDSRNRHRAPRDP